MKAGLAATRRVLRRTVEAFLEDGVMQYGAALAYYAVVSIGPLIILSVPLLGQILGSGLAESRIIGQAGLLAGPQGAEIARTVLSEDNRPEIGSVGTWLSIALFASAATAVFANLQGALNKIWGVEPVTGAVRNLLRTRLMAFAMVLGLGFLTILSFLVGAFLSWAGHLVEPLRDILPMVKMADILTSWLLLWWFVGMVFSILPDVRISWKDVWVGALATSGLLVLSRYALTAIVAQNATASMYGAAGSIFLLLLWIYLSAQIFFLGAEFTEVWVEERGREIRPEHYARRVDCADEGERPHAVDPKPARPGTAV